MRAAAPRRRRLGGEPLARHRRAGGAAVGERLGGPARSVRRRGGDHPRRPGRRPPEGRGGACRDGGRAGRPHRRPRRRERCARPGGGGRVRLDAPTLAAARASVWTTILHASFEQAVAATRAGRLDRARAWLLVREFRPPTRFTRAAADATLALERLRAESLTAEAAAAAVRRDLLDTYDGRIRSTLAVLDEARRLGFAPTRAEAGALALGYWSILGPSYRAQRGPREWRRATDGARRARRRRAQRAGRPPGAAARRAPRSRGSGRRRSPRTRRSGGPASSTGSSASSRSSTGAGSATGASRRISRSRRRSRSATAPPRRSPTSSRACSPATPRRRAASRRRSRASAASLVTASRGGTPVDPSTLDATVASAVDDLGALYPAEWKDAAETADFDVIAATLDRMQAAAASGDWGAAESARIEAYGIFELGPGAAASRPRAVALPGGRIALLVRHGRPRRARSPHQGEGVARRARGGESRARRRRSRTPSSGSGAVPARASRS